uniref:Membrane fusion protein Use1 n=2 Tax=Kalanchoe fedtschenkoi TaxID=63787 RepID=A0A7N0T0C3_KALFE
MGLSKTEVNLRRLLAAAPRQQNQAKLIHYVATMRELLEQLSLESTPDGLPSVSKAMLSEFSEKIEAIASTVVPQLPELQVSRVNFAETSIKLSPTKTGEAVDQFTPSSPGLRRRHVHFEDRTHTTSDANHSATVKLDSKAHAHIEKHRKLQEDLTDEMVELAQQLKESTLVMSQSLKNTEKILDSTEKAVEQSLASTNRAGARAMAIYSETSKTTCFTWLLMFVMTCVFMMVVLLIRIT